VGCCWPCGIREKDCWPYWGGPGRPLFPPPKNELEPENILIAFETLLSSSPLRQGGTTIRLLMFTLPYAGRLTTFLSCCLALTIKVNRGSFPDMLPAKTCVNDDLYNIALLYYCVGIEETHLFEI
jgi:hypothetical protein